MSLPVLGPSFKNVMELMYQSYVPRILNAAVEIGLFEELSKKDCTLQELSDHLKADERIVEALVDLLIAVDLIEGSRETMRLTDMAREFLVQSSPVNQIIAIQGFSGSDGPLII